MRRVSTRASGSVAGVSGKGARGGPYDAGPMVIRDAEPSDLPAIARFFRAIGADGETYAYPEDLDDQGIADLWMAAPGGRWFT